MATALKLKPDTRTEVLLSAIEPDPLQPRKSFAAAPLKALADNIRERGIQVPILVRAVAAGKKPVIVDGERRWRAAKLAKLKKVPVLLVKASGDQAQTSMDQVSLNSLREDLSPMEEARFLTDLQVRQKLTVNDIAARLSKQGRTITRQQVAAAVQMVKLPAWAQAWIDQDKLDPAAAPMLLTALEEPFLKGAKFESQLGQLIGWNGRIKPRDLQGAIAGLFRDAGAPDLRKTESYHSDKHRVHFDPKKVCAKCEFKRQLGHDLLCTNPKRFKENNDAAKAAGLGPGGTRAQLKDVPKDQLTKRQAARLEEQKAEQREKRDETRVETYLDNWLRPRLQERIRSLASQGHELRIVCWLAAQAPDAGLTDENRYLYTLQRHASELAAALPERRTLADFLAAPVEYPEIHELAAQAVHVMTPGQVREAAQAVGISIAEHWLVDEAFLSLRMKAELVAIVRAHNLVPEGGKPEAMKAPELRALILASPEAVKFNPTQHAAHDLLNTAFHAPVRDPRLAAEEEEEELDDGDWGVDDSVDDPIDGEE